MESVNKSVLSRRIIELRGDKSRKEFASLIGMSEGAVEKYEKKLSIPSSEVAVRISEIGDVSIEWLLGLSDRRKPNIDADSAAAVIITAGKVAETIAERIDDIPYDPKEFGEAFRDLLEHAIRQQKNDEEIGTVVDFQAERISRKLSGSK